MSKKYTVSEISRQTGDNSRQIQRKLKNLINIDKGSYLIDESIVNMLYPETTHDNHVAALSLDVEYDVEEGFTNEEYAEFQKRLIEYPMLKEQIPFLKEQIEYHKNSALEHQRQSAIILKTIEQRNYIEAKDKNLE